MVDSYHPFWWWRGCIMYLLLRECLFTHEFQCKKKRKTTKKKKTKQKRSIDMLLSWEVAQWRERESQIVFFKKKKETVPWPMGCALNSTRHLLLAFLFFEFSSSLFAAVVNLFGLGRPDLLLRKVAFSTITAKHGLLCLAATALLWKYAVGADVCGDSVRPQAWDLPHEWCVAYSQPGVPRVEFAVDLVWTAHTSFTLCLYTHRCDSACQETWCGSRFFGCRITCFCVAVSQLQKHWMGRNSSV